LFPPAADSWLLDDGEPVEDDETTVEDSVRGGGGGIGLETG